MYLLFILYSSYPYPSLFLLGLIVKGDNFFTAGRIKNIGAGKTNPDLKTQMNRETKLLGFQTRWQPDHPLYFSTLFL